MEFCILYNMNKFEYYLILDMHIKLLSNEYLYSFIKLYCNNILNVSK